MTYEMDVFDVVFPPNKSRKNLRLAIVIISIFLFISLFFLLAGIGSASEAGELNADFWRGIGIFSFCVLLFVLVFFFTAARGVSYIVGSKRIVLVKKSTSKEIPYSDIESIVHMTEEESEAFYKNKVIELSREQMSLMNGFDLTKIKDAFQMQKEAEKKYAYLSVARAQISTNKRRGYSIEDMEKNLKTDLPCSTVYIKLKNGEDFLISPKDSLGFYDEVKKHMRH